VSPHQPVVSGRRLIKALEADGWEVVRQRGSHVRLRKAATRSDSDSPLGRPAGMMGA
jgi:predicted RNA binding protein YcfA (HicA-like mRNA interferase family)